mgnify:CR=1 FL=1
MNITVVRSNVVSLSDFADRHGLSIVVRERPQCVDDGLRFFASFDGAEVKDGSMLVAAHGNGADPNRAIASYASEIAGQVLVVDAWRVSRREIAVPANLVYAPVSQLAEESGSKSD